MPRTQLPCTRGVPHYTENDIHVNRTVPPKRSPARREQASGNEIKERRLRRLEVEHNRHRRAQADNVRHEARVEVRLNAARVINFHRHDRSASVWHDQSQKGQGRAGRRQGVH